MKGKKRHIYDVYTTTMRSDKILKGWTSYDNKKIIEGGDIKYFNCKENWEVDYLTKKIAHSYPGILESHLREIIILCCTELPDPPLRNEIVRCIIKKLNQK